MKRSTRDESPDKKKRPSRCRERTERKTQAAVRKHHGENSDAQGLAAEAIKLTRDGKIKRKESVKGKSAENWAIKEKEK